MINRNSTTDKINLFDVFNIMFWCFFSGFIAALALIDELRGELMDSALDAMEECEQDLTPDSSCKLIAIIK